MGIISSLGDFLNTAFKFADESPGRTVFDEDVLVAREDLVDEPYVSIAEKADDGNVIQAFADKGVLPDFGPAAFEDSQDVTLDTLRGRDSLPSASVVEDTVKEIQSNFGPVEEARIVNESEFAVKASPRDAPTATTAEFRFKESGGEVEDINFFGQPDFAVGDMPATGDPTVGKDPLAVDEAALRRAEDEKTLSLTDNI